MAGVRASHSSRAYRGYITGFKTRPNGSNDEQLAVMLYEFVVVVTCLGRTFSLRCYDLN